MPRKVRCMIHDRKNSKNLVKLSYLRNSVSCRSWRWTTWTATWRAAPSPPSRPPRMSWPTSGSWMSAWSWWTCPTRLTGTTTLTCASCSRRSTHPTSRIRYARWLSGEKTTCDRYRADISPRKPEQEWPPSIGGIYCVLYTVLYIVQCTPKKKYPYRRMTRVVINWDAFSLSV